jgi:hypothetical protein
MINPVKKEDGSGGRVVTKKIVKIKGISIS